MIQTKADAPKKDKNKPNKKCPDEGQPGPSTQQTPGQKKNGKEKGSCKLSLFCFTYVSFA